MQAAFSQTLSMLGIAILISLGVSATYILLKLFKLAWLAGKVASTSPAAQRIIFAIVDILLDIGCVLALLFWASTLTEKGLLVTALIVLIGILVFLVSNGFQKQGD